MPTLTAKITPEDIQRILNGTDWNAYARAVNWSTQTPRCHFYDGEWAQ